MERKLLLAELDQLISSLDEHINLFCQRIDFMRIGQSNKAKFIDERILPTVDSKIKQQTERVLKLLFESKSV